MISRKGKYAIRSALFLARHYGQGPISVKRIASSEGISRKFLERIMHEMKEGGILQSYSGKFGGYMLRQPPGKISIGSIIRAIDGTLSPVQCVSASAYSPCVDCPSEKDCRIRLVMKNVSQAISWVLDLKSVEQLLREGDDSNQEIIFEI